MALVVAPVARPRWGAAVLVTILIALGGAIGVAVGFVVQQHAAAQEPASERLHFRLLGHLIQRPLWLGGIAAMAGGQILGAIALGRGDLALVEPIMAANLLFALPLSALWHHRRLGPREWIGACALVCGLAAFIAAGDPHGGSTSRLPWPNWVISGGCIVAVATVLTARGRRTAPPLQATLFATAAGTLYGLQDALTQRSMAELRSGVLSMLVSWPAMCLLVVAVAGLLLAQSAFEAAPLPASLPAMTVAEPVTGIGFGVGVYGEHLNLAPTLLATELGGLAVMIAGVILVAGSKVVTGAALTEPEIEAERAA